MNQDSGYTLFIPFKHKPTGCTSIQWSNQGQPRFRIVGNRSQIILSCQPEINEDITLEYQNKHLMLWIVKKRRYHKNGLFDNSTTILEGNLKIQLFSSSKITFNTNLVVKRVGFS